VARRSDPWHSNIDSAGNARIKQALRIRRRSHQGETGRVSVPPGRAPRPSGTSSQPPEEDSAPTDLRSETHSVVVDFSARSLCKKDGIAGADTLERIDARLLARVRRRYQSLLRSFRRAPRSTRSGPQIRQFVTILPGAGPGTAGPRPLSRWCSLSASWRFSAAASICGDLDR